MDPALALPSYRVYRGSLLALLVGSIVAVWLLVLPVVWHMRVDKQPVTIPRPRRAGMSVAQGMPLAEINGLPVFRTPAADITAR